MELRELRSFIILAEQLHFMRAARVLHLSQPALTKQIHRLEEELGSPLFERGKSGTKLSTFGERFLTEVKGSILRFDQLLERTRRDAVGETGLLRIGTGVPTLKNLPRIIVQLHEAAPGIEVSLRALSTDEQITELYSGRIDAGLLRLPVPSAFNSMELTKDRMALVSAATTPRAQQATLADFRDEPFVVISEEYSPGFFKHMLRLSAKHGFHPKVVQEVPEYTTALALVQLGLGVTLIPESFWDDRFPGTRLHPIHDKEASWSVGLAWRKRDKSPALMRFLDLLRKDLIAKMEERAPRKTNPRRSHENAD